MAQQGKPRKVPPQIWALVCAELDAGATYEHVQGELARSTPPIQISISMMQKYRAADRKRLPKGPAVSMDATLERLQARADARRGGPALDPLKPAEPMPDGTDLEALLRRQLRDSATAAERARQLGDSVVAAREAKNMAELSAQLGRAQKHKSALRDVITFTRAELNAGMRSVRDKVAAIVQRPLMCAGCARALAAALTGVDLTPAAEV